jgi:hypothetical protein
MRGSVGDVEPAREVAGNGGERLLSVAACPEPVRARGQSTTKTIPKTPTVATRSATLVYEATPSE